jgi:hypothetical protein
MKMLNRRTFMKTASAVAAGSLGATRFEAFASQAQLPVAKNDHIQIALIGAGGQGQFDTGIALEIPGVKLVAVADCYDGRLEHSTR